MKLLLVTGAGASRKLGHEPIALMSDWSARLCQALDDCEEGLSAACQLAPNADGPSFEPSLGTLLETREVLGPLVTRFKGLFTEAPGAETPEIDHGVSRLSERYEVVMDVLNMTLYREFGVERIDRDKAVATYKALLARLDDPELIVATTNYDRSAELALRHLGRQVTTGFLSTDEATPYLDTRDLGWTTDTRTPVIHLQQRAVQRLSGNPGRPLPRSAKGSAQ